VKFSPSFQHGQLGLGHTKRVPLPVPFLSPQDLKFTSFACGAAHTLALTTEGSLYSFGRNAEFQLGIGTNGEDKSTPQHVALNHVKKIVCGEWSSVAITKSGNLYFWGKLVPEKSGTRAYRKGEQDCGSFACLPKEIESPAGPVIDATCMASALFFLTASREIFSVKFENRELRTAHVQTNFIPMAIGYFSKRYLAILNERSELIQADVCNGYGIRSFIIAENVLDFACGVDHLVFYLKDGNAWATGSNEKFQGGHNKSSGEYHVPIPNGDIIAQVGAGKFFSYAISVEGKLFFSGTCADLFGKYETPLRFTKFTFQTTKVCEKNFLFCFSRFFFDSKISKFFPSLTFLVGSPVLDYYREE
jgi:alpha-tubulin suppressor-like RCC1 family protein